MGVLLGTDEGSKLLDTMTKHTMNEIRCLIDYLIEKEYDSRKPIARTEQEILVGREVCSKLISRLIETQEQTTNLLDIIHEDLATLIEMTDVMQNSFIPSLGNIPFKANRSGADLVNDFDSLLRNLKDTYQLCKDHAHHNLLDDAENQNFAIDSDEEERDR